MAWINSPDILNSISEPIYESVVDKNIVAAVTLWLKKAWFEKWTSYVLTQSHKNELVISITKIHWNEVKNTWSISLQKWIDFVEKNGNTTITEQWIQKMKDNYEGIKNLLPQKEKIISAIWNEIDDLNSGIQSA